jgi:hypothetical protein
LTWFTTTSSTSKYCTDHRLADQPGVCHRAICGTTVHLCKHRCRLRRARYRRCLFRLCGRRIPPGPSPWRSGPRRSRRACPAPGSRRPAARSRSPKRSAGWPPTTIHRFSSAASAAICMSWSHTSAQSTLHPASSRLACGDPGYPETAPLGELHEAGALLMCQQHQPPMADPLAVGSQLTAPCAAANRMRSATGTYVSRPP